MKNLKKWWFKQFDSKTEGYIWFFCVAVMCALAILLEILNRAGVNTVIF
jgi:hypothetical protein